MMEQEKKQSLIFWALVTVCFGIIGGACYRYEKMEYFQQTKGNWGGLAGRNSSGFPLPYAQHLIPTSVVEENPTILAVDAVIWLLAAILFVWAVYVFVDKLKRKRDIRS